jgi:hypothetical protein
VSNYTANLAAAITTAVPIDSIQALSDLKGKTVWSHDAYTPRLAAAPYNYATTPKSWAGSTTFSEVMMSVALACPLSRMIISLKFFKNSLNSDCTIFR